MDTRALRHVFGRDRRSPQTTDLARFHFDNAFHDLPKPTGPYPFRLDLRSVLGQEAVDDIAKSKKMVFHSVGDTGYLKYGAEAQDAVAACLVTQREQTTGPDQPVFFYHLGDVVYYNGARKAYEPQFYEPYQDYTAPIFAIPGNHDGAVLSGDGPLQGFMENFCASQPRHTWMAGNSNRTTMIQPNCYWTLKTPLATIIGLYSNVPGRLDLHDSTQQDWFVNELKAAKSDACVIVAVHHPPYSLDSTHGGHEAIRQSIDSAILASGKVPNLVLTAHVHNYQSFERDVTALGGKKLWYVVAGAGGFAGYTGLHHLKAGASLPAGVRLNKSETKLPSFLRLTITHKKLTCEAFTAPPPGSHLSGKATLIESLDLPL